MNFETLQQIIQNRRSTKPALMNGKKIEDSLIEQLLQLANWAPTHARTEPWRCIVFANEEVKNFCKAHADLYKANAPEEKFEPSKYESMMHMGDGCSHIIATYMKRGANPKIPVLEEICSAAASVEKILLGASALNIAALWSTGGLTHHAAMKSFFHLGEDDIMLGLLYLGYADEPFREGKRLIPLS
jgi:nitroreductase